MDMPPSGPTRQPRPLGALFVLILLAPIVLFAIALSMNDASRLGAVLAWSALIGAPVCAVTCAILVARSGTSPGSRGGLAVLTFFGLALLYGGTAFAGCVYSLRGL